MSKSTKPRVPKRLAGFQCPSEFIMIIVVPYYWGHGATIEEAVAKTREHGGGSGLASGPIRIYLSRDKEAFVGGDGSICWRSPEDCKSVYDDPNRPFVIWESKK